MNRLIPAALALILTALVSAPLVAEVILSRVPEGGLQPQALVGRDGTLHLVYFQGEPKSGDLFYVRRLPGSTAFTTPTRVNSEPSSAIAIGTIRGPQIALGKGARPHVAWNGSGKATIHDGAPMLYTRLSDNGTAFEPQRDVMTFTSGLDGGGSVAADNSGNVYVVWHGKTPDASQSETERAVFVAVSTDEGKTFAREYQANPDPTGACGCCGMKAFCDAGGSLYLLYREARSGTESRRHDPRLPRPRRHVSKPLYASVGDNHLSHELGLAWPRHGSNSRRMGNRRPRMVHSNQPPFEKRSSEPGRGHRRAVEVGPRFVTHRSAAKHRQPKTPGRRFQSERRDAPRLDRRHRLDEGRSRRLASLRPRRQTHAC